jgi:hypothetical protein
MAGQQCHLRLWRECYQRDLSTPPDARTQALLDSGQRIGQLATERYPGGEWIDEDYRQLDEAVEHTGRALASTAPALFEAAFRYQDVRVRVDVLQRVSADEWDVIEVKSSGSVHAKHIADLALQVWVVRGAGLKVRRACVLTVNNRYVYGGADYDLQQLFALHDRSAAVAEAAEAMAEGITDLHEMLGRPDPPDILPGPHCHRPHRCSFYAHCTRDVEPVEYPLRDLPSLGAARLVELAQDGYEDIRELPDSLRLSPLQRRARAAAIAGAPVVSPGLSDVLSAVEYPIHHLDFETFGGPLPRYAGTRPFQGLPFQWSNHIEHPDGRVEHHEYLCRNDCDPRPECARLLLASLGGAGTIVTYGTHEVTVIRRLMAAVPRYRQALGALVARCWNLHPVIREHYYHPEFHGSFSLKRVLPVLAPALSYAYLEVSDGLQASLAYVEPLETPDLDQRARIQAALLAYCKRDTLAMLEVRHALARESGRA